MHVGRERTKFPSERSHGRSTRWSGGRCGALLGESVAELLLYQVFDLRFEILRRRSTLDDFAFLIPDPKTDRVVEARDSPFAPVLVGERPPGYRG